VKSLDPAGFQEHSLVLRGSVRPDSSIPSLSEPRFIMGCGLGIHLLLDLGPFCLSRGKTIHANTKPGSAIPLQ
jgi:hypothetical protein